MAYSQKPLIELMKRGTFLGEKTKPEHIETVISNVFISKDKVYKIYKNNNEFFNKGFRNISQRSARLSFTKRDFEWNNTLNPSVYLETVGVCVKDGTVQGVANRMEELVIVMKRIDNKDILFERLVAGKVSENDCYTMGKQLAKNLAKVQKKFLKKHNYFKVFKSLIDDAYGWAKVASKYITIKELKQYCDFLDSFRKKNKSLFQGQLSKGITCIGDIHSHNAVFSNKTLYLMDTFPPKESWFVGHAVIPLYRLATDIWALTGKKELFNEFIKGYESDSDFKIDRKLDPIYIIYSSIIMISYLYMLQETDASKRDAAKKFHLFIREYFSKIKVKQAPNYPSPPSSNPS